MLWKIIYKMKVTSAEMIFRLEAVGAPLLLCIAGKVLKGWRVYPLQLDDLKPIPYSSPKRQAAQVSDEAAEPGSAGEGLRPLAAPAAEEVGPIFYR